MKRFKSKVATLSLLGLLCAGNIGCSTKSNTDDILDFGATTFNYETEFIDESLELPNDSSVSGNSLEDEIDIISVDTALAVNRTPIIEDLETNKVKGYLPVGKSLDIVEKLDNGYYKVDHFGEFAYLKESDVEVASVYDIKSPIKKMLFATEDTTLIIPDYLSDTSQEEKVEIKKFEVFEVYDETDILYLVKTPEYIGYISKEKVEELTGTFVVLDISDQKIILYRDNTRLKEYPTITGTPNATRQTDIGKWEVYNISHNRYLQDARKTYSSAIDIMIKFNGGEGFHDSTYHTCDYWKSKGRSRHGWRTEEQIYTSDTYLKNGSHGCANMINEDVFELAEYLEIGTPVIVKR